MTPDEFRAWRRRNRLSRAALRDTLRDFGWTKVTIHAVNSWGVRGPPEHVALILALLERYLECSKPHTRVENKPRTD